MIIHHNPQPPPSQFQLPATYAQCESMSAMSKTQDPSEFDRNPDHLDIDFRHRLDRVFAQMKAQGYDMKLLEGYRAPGRQDALLAQGETGLKVTAVGNCHSFHQYGLAADAALVKDGKLVLDMKSEWSQKGYQLYGQLAAQEGLRWGGSWSDNAHVELHRARELPLPAKLDARYQYALIAGVPKMRSVLWTFIISPLEP